MALIYDNPNHLLIGLGGTGGKILKEFKLRMWREHPSSDEREALRPTVAFLYVDSTREMLKENDDTWRVLGQNAMFTENEFLNIKPQSSTIGQILDHVDNYPGLRYIVKNGTAMKQTLGNIGDAAGQMRRAGRIMFASNVNIFNACLESKFSELKNRTRLNSLHVHIFTGLAGGTGSGAIIDAVCQILQKFPEAEIDVYAMIPEPSVPVGLDKGRYYPNGYAALRELSALNVCKFLPSNVQTGEEHVGLNIGLNKQFGLMLYTNVNENGVVIDSLNELPKLVADTLYYRLYLPNNPNTQSFFRAWSCENATNFLVEYDTKAKGAIKERARTKATSTFGIKRIVYPEIRIMEHMAYSIALRVLYQMKYNNFKEEGEGYVDEKPHVDYSEFTKDTNNLRLWKLDSSHLLLNEKILDSDKNIDTFDVFWENIVIFYSYDDAKQNDSQPLRYLENYCEDVFRNSFRGKQGVEDYYKDKSGDKVIREQSRTILDAIERHLYSEWYNGTYSLTTMSSICEEILAYIKKNQENLEREISECDTRIDDYMNEVSASNEDYDNMTLLGRIAGKDSRIYSTHQMIMKDLYLQRTQRVALRFKGKLLLRLRADFEDFRNQLNDFEGVIHKSQDNLIKCIADRTKEKNRLSLKDVDFSRMVIEVSEDDKMIEFEERLAKDKTKMDALAAILRKKLVEEKDYAHLGDLAAQIDANHTVTDIAERFITPQVLAYHDSDPIYAHDKIVGINVLQELEKVLGTNEDAMDKFAKEVILHCSVFLEQEISEVNKVLRNNEDQSVITNPAAMNNSCVMISLPNYDGDDNLKVFAEKLERALYSAMGSATAGSSICIDHSGRTKNEITLVQVRSLFPVRTIKHLPNLKAKYEMMINNPNESERVSARILLHCEGDGQSLPQLEGEGEGPRGDELLPYFFLAAALGILRIAENHLEEKGWCYVSKDEFGTPLITLISQKFITIETSENMTNETRDSILDSVEDYLHRDDLKRSEREEIKQKVADIMRKYVADETGGAQSMIYQKYATAAKTAMKKIMNEI